jgi:CheY-like chemotaxis protein
VRAENRRDGTGAVFTVSLPCLAPVDGIAESAARAASRTGSAAPPALPLRGIRILVVEDDFDSADGLATLLARRGAEVAVADSFAGALEHLDRGLPDVLVSDIALPDGDGYELLARVRAMSGNRSTPVPAIALTAYAGVEHSRKATSVGYEVHFAKPFDTDDLIAVIARLAVHTRASS